MTISLVLADDHPLILYGLNNLLLPENDIAVLASCTNGVDALREVRIQQPDVVVLDIFMSGMSGLEVHGILLKKMALQFIVQCIRKVYAGEQWVERQSTSQTLEKILRREAGGREAAALLTRREIELVCLVAVGLRNKEIADKLFISEGTVKVHLHNIYEKLSVKSRIGLLLYAQEKCLI